MIKVGDLLLDRSEELAAAKERTLKRCTYIEYALFVVGWSIGLIGKFAKIGKETEEEYLASA